MVYKETNEVLLTNTQIDSIIDVRNKLVDEDIVKQSNDIKWRHAHDYKINKDESELSSKKAKLHALLFYKYAKDVPGASYNFNDLLIKSNHGDRSLTKIQKSLDNISLWINRFIADMHHQPKCKSIRKVYIKDKNEIEYY